MTETTTQIATIEAELADLRQALSETDDWYRAQRLRSIISARQSELRALRRHRP